MHGIWLLMFVPLGAIVAWRYSSLTIRKAALVLLMLASVSFVGWFGYLTVAGTELTESIFDRVMNSLGIVLGAINIPVCQLLLALGVVVLWPKSWEFAGRSRVPEPAPSRLSGDTVQSEVD